MMSKTLKILLKEAMVGLEEFSLVYATHNSSRSPRPNNLKSYDHQ